MKRFHSLTLSIVILLAGMRLGHARAIAIWPYQELFDKSDLVVMATPVSIHDTSEKTVQAGFAGEESIGIETTFKTSVVLKGDAAQKSVVLHHYRLADSLGATRLPNGPTYVSFVIEKAPTPLPRTYLLFLRREADGRYAPTVGQMDPGTGIREIKGLWNDPAGDVRAEVDTAIDKVIRECESLRPGVTRSELMKVFTTEGGLSTVTHRTYVHREHRNIKVDVDFAPAKAGQNTEQPTDAVTAISRPYLGRMIAD